jgi:hypothetical protein
MLKRATRTHENRKRWWRLTPSSVLAGTALFIVLGGSAVAASGLIQAGDIAPGAVTSRAIRGGAVEPRDLSASTRALFGRAQGAVGAKGNVGSTGATGTPGASGINGANGPNGANGNEGARGSNGANGANGNEGAKGSNGANGANGNEGAKGSNGANGANGNEGAKGSNGANGANGPNGANGTNGIDGTNGVNGAKGENGTNGASGTNGTNGTNGTIAPLSATQGLTALPTGAPPTTVVELAVPMGKYVVMAKTELSQTGAGDSVECLLKSGATTVDQAAMKTLPALAAVPAALQAVITATTSPTVLSVQCTVAVANGSANYNSLIAIPTA